MKNTWIIIFTLLNITINYGQEETSSKAWQPSNITFRLGSETSWNGYTDNASGFIDRSGASTNLIDPSKPWFPYYNSSASNNFIGLDLEFKHLNKNSEKLISGFKTRFGLNYSHKTMEGISYQDWTVLSNDTFVSNTTGDEIYSETWNTTNSYVTFNTKEIRADISALIHTSEKRSISFYTGFGVQIGGVIQSTINLETSTEENTIYITPSTDETTGFNDEFNTFPSTSFKPSETLTEKGKTYLLAGAYIPLGFNIQLSKKDNFLKHFSLNSEVRLGINTGNGRSYFTANTTGGLRVNL